MKTQKDLKARIRIMHGARDPIHIHTHLDLSFYYTKKVFFSPDSSLKPINMSITDLHSACGPAQYSKLVTTNFTSALESYWLEGIFYSKKDYEKIVNNKLSYLLKYKEKLNKKERYEVIIDKKIIKRSVTGLLLYDQVIKVFEDIRQKTSQRYALAQVKQKNKE